MVKSLIALFYRIKAWFSSQSIAARRYGRFVEQKPHGCSKAKWHAYNIKHLEVPMTNWFWRNIAILLREWRFRSAFSNNIEVRPNMDNATHDCIQVDFDCVECLEKFPITYELGGKKKHHTFGSYTEILNVHQEMEVDFPYTKVEEVFGNMWSSYHLAFKNCKYWSNSFYTNLTSNDPYIKDVQQFLDIFPNICLFDIPKKYEQLTIMQQICMFCDKLKDGRWALTDEISKLFRLIILKMSAQLNVIPYALRLRILMQFIDFSSKIMYPLFDFKVKCKNATDEKLKKLKTVITVQQMLQCQEKFQKVALYDANKYVKEFLKHFNNFIEIYDKSKQTVNDPLKYVEFRKFFFTNYDLLIDSFYLKSGWETGENGKEILRALAMKPEDNPVIPDSKLEYYSEVASTYLECYFLNKPTELKEGLSYIKKHWND